MPGEVLVLLVSVIVYPIVLFGVFLLARARRLILYRVLLVFAQIVVSLALLAGLYSEAGFFYAVVFMAIVLMWSVVGLCDKNKYPFLSMFGRVSGFLMWWTSFALTIVFAGPEASFPVVVAGLCVAGMYMVFSTHLALRVVGAVALDLLSLCLSLLGLRVIVWFDVPGPLLLAGIGLVPLGLSYLWAVASAPTCILWVQSVAFWLAISSVMGPLADGSGLGLMVVGLATIGLGGLFCLPLYKRRRDKAAYHTQVPVDVG